MEPHLEPLSSGGPFARRASSHATARIYAWFFVLGLLAIGLPTALGQTKTPPAFLSSQLSNTEFNAMLAVPSWVKQITLESKSNVTDGAWRIMAWQEMTGAGLVTYQLSNSQPMTVLRARADAAPSFLERVRTGLGIISNSYPGAIILSITAGPGAATTNPNDIIGLSIRCRVSGGTATITSTNGLTFDPVQFSGGLVAGVSEIPWPISLDVMQAAILLERAGYTGTFTSFAVVWPLVPGGELAYYFDLSSGNTIRVSIMSQEVSP